MLDHVANVAACINRKSIPRSPDTKAALAYLAASGAAPIFVTEVGDVATIRTGSKVDPRAVVVFWIAGRTPSRSSRSPDVSPARTKTSMTRSCR